MTDFTHSPGRSRTRWALTRMRRWRSMLAPLSVLAAAALAIPLATGGALLTTNSVVNDNRVETGEPDDSSYGLFSPVLRPYVGAAFSEGTRGFLSFKTWASDGFAPQPYPSIGTGEKLRFIVDLPAALAIDPTPNHSGGAIPGRPQVNFCDGQPLPTLLNLYLTVSCTEIAHSSGSSSIEVSFTAKRALSGANIWSQLKTLGFGVVGTAGLVDGDHAAHLTAIYPHSEGIEGPLTAVLPYRTSSLAPSTLGLWNPKVETNAGSVRWAYGTEGVARWDIDPDTDAKPIRIDTGESFSVRAALPQITTSGNWGGLEYNPTPSTPVPDVCTDRLPGFDVTCATREADHLTNEVHITFTRTGPLTDDAFPTGAHFELPLRSSYAFVSTGGTPAVGYVELELSSSLHQPGADALWYQLRTEFENTAGLSKYGVHRASARPYVGDRFGEDSYGRARFTFLDPSAPGLPGDPPTVHAGEDVIVRMELPPALELDLTPTYPEQGELGKNWCDTFNWDDERDALLTAPICADVVHPDGSSSWTITTTALQDLPAEVWEHPFLVRVRAVSTLTETSAPVTFTLSLPDDATAGARQSTATVHVPTVPGPSSTLGVWSPEVKPLDYSPSWALGETGSVLWFSEPSRDVAPFSVRTGDRIEYDITLPDGLEHRSRPGAVDTCVDGIGDGWDLQCVERDGGITVKITRTGPPVDDALLGDRLPLEIPLVSTYVGAEMYADVTIRLTTTLQQAGSAQPFARITTLLEEYAPPADEDAVAPAPESPPTPSEDDPVGPVPAPEEEDGDDTEGIDPAEPTDSREPFTPTTDPSAHPTLSGARGQVTRKSRSRHNHP